MRTTIRIDDHLLAQAKRLAAETGRTLTAVIEDALREAMQRRRFPGKRRRISLTTVSGRGILPGVDLYHAASWLDVLDC